jgi:DNA-binding NtrC family response regulator
MSTTNLSLTHTILLIDDDPASLLALSEALRLRLGDITVDTVDTAEDGLSLMSSTDYDVIISDVVMPSMNGIAFLKEARRRQPTVQVILITAGDTQLEHEALALGAHTFVAKPLDVDRFIPVVAGALAQARRDRERGDSHSYQREQKND